MTHIDPTALSVDAPDGVITTARLRASGFSASRIAARCRPGGPWQRLLPGVLLLGAGAPTRRQQIRAAVARFGGEAVVSGADALCALGARHPVGRGIHLLVSPACRMTPGEFVLTQRTGRLPEPVVIDGIPFAPPARATIDAARRELDPRRLRRLLRLPLYWGLCSKSQLCAELEAGNQRGSAAVRSALDHLDTTAGTFAHGVAGELLAQTPVPPPSWDVSVCDTLGRTIAVADAWWDELALAWQFVSGKPLPQLALKAAGVVVVRTTVEDMRTAPDAVRKEIVSAFLKAGKRARPRVQGFRDVPLDRAA
jgi:hypothetical protein